MDTKTFKGYNHNLQIADGEFYDMKNLTSSYYPALSPRTQRGKYSTTGIPNGIIAKEKICYTDGRYIVIGNDRIDMGLSDNPEPKTLISMGAYIIIMPDKKYINTLNPLDRGSIEHYFDSGENQVKLTLARNDGTKYTVRYRQAETPSNPNNADYWLDTSATPNVLKQYSSASAQWVTIATTYIRIESAGIGLNFKEYDGVNIDWFGSDVDSRLEAIKGSFVIYSRDADYITIVGIIDEEITTTTGISVSRRMPKMDYICESENRLWGCRYGTNNKGEIVNEIYASKLGDFKNWESFLGISTDSYVASVGSDGKFTGAITYLGNPLFFKENCVHKVYGNFPSDYQILTNALRGVQEGSSRSLAMLNETLFYKSRSGICAYDGSLPQEVSQAFGDELYNSAIACSHGGKYYVTMKDSKNGRVLFVYDSKYGMWHKEDDTYFIGACSFGDDLYYIDEKTRDIKTMLGSGVKDEDNIEWEALSKEMGIDTESRKVITKLAFRLKMTEASRLDIFIEYDSSGEWECITSLLGNKTLYAFTMPIVPRRCDHFRIKLKGINDVKLYGITKTLEDRSDV